MDIQLFVYDSATTITTLLRIYRNSQCGVSPVYKGYNSVLSFASGDVCSIGESSSSCVPTPCLAGGTCIALPDENFVCQCPNGRSGERCENGKNCGTSN